MGLKQFFNRNKKSKYYDRSVMKKIMHDHNCKYGLVFGERSNGKTYSYLEEAIENYVNNGKQSAYIRRWKEDLVGQRGANLLSGHTKNNVITRLTKGEWDGVFYQSQRWYFSRWDDEKRQRVHADEPFLLGFSLNDMEHDKGNSYPNIDLIIFDEFLTRGQYLVDEFVLFMNVVSTIVRDRDDVTIMMLGNTVNNYSPYFKEMGIDGIKNQEQGTIQIYEYEGSDLRVAVEYCESKSEHKKSNVYFEFKNSRLSMITGGGWEFDIYPHNPIRYNKLNDVAFSYFICFDNEIFQADIVTIDDVCYTYIHRKTTDIKKPDEDLIYSPIYDPRLNWRRNILKPSYEFEKKLLWFFKNDKVFYQDNMVGESIRNYMNWCKTNK